MVGTGSRLQLYENSPLFCKRMPTIKVLNLVLYLDEYLNE
jgi:hypothetical protein